MQQGYNKLTIWKKKTDIKSGKRQKEQNNEKEMSEKSKIILN